MNNTKRMLRRRGGATVELAIMMVFLIPTFLYSLFLDDLLNFKLEMQETIVSTPWDYNFIDYNKAKLADSASSQQPQQQQGNDEDDGSDGNGAYNPSENKENNSGAQAQPAGVDNIVARQSRRTYCDHSSAYDSYNIENDCRDQSQKHHSELSAHQCWLTAKHGSGGGRKAKQVTCGRSQDDFSSVPVFSSSFNSTYNAGGIIRCEAALGVTNYFLPNKFFEFWSKVDVTKMKRFQTGTGQTAAHSDAEGVSTSESIIFAVQAHSVLHDPFAVNRPAAINPDESSPESRFRDRMLSFWNAPAAIGVTPAMAWGGQMVSQGLLSPLALTDSVGDNLMSPPMAWKSEAKRQFPENGGGPKHHTSSWTDNRHSQSHGARKTTYFAQDTNYQ